MNKAAAPASDEERDNQAELARHLTSLRQAPSPALTERVRAISRSGSSRAQSGRLAWTALALVMTGLLLAWPGARTAWGQVDRLVGQIHLVVQEALFRPEAPSLPLESRAMSLAEARATVPFDFGLPVYLPAGLAAGDGRVMVANLAGPMVKMEWRDTQGGVVQLTAHPPDSVEQPVQTLIGPDSSETVLINNRPAALVRGGWDQASRAWAYQDQIITVIWQNDGVQYRLLAVSTVVSLEELIKMAESIHERTDG